MKRHMNRWVEQYLELSAVQTMVTGTVMNTVPDLMVLKELDTLPNQEELSKSTDCLACGKLPGNNGIPCILKSGTPVLLRQVLLRERLHSPGHTTCQCHHLIQEQGRPK